MIISRNRKVNFLTLLSLIADNQNTQDLFVLTQKRHNTSVEKGRQNKSKISKHTFVITKEKIKKPQDGYDRARLL